MEEMLVRRWFWLIGWVGVVVSVATAASTSGEQERAVRLEGSRVERLVVGQARPGEGRVAASASMAVRGRSASSGVSASRGLQRGAARGESHPMAKRRLSREVAGYAAQRTGVTSGPRPVSRGASGRKLVALTYDDGPNPVITPKLVELLRAKHARATFFLLGDSVRAHPELVKTIVDAGMEVGNHSDTHPLLTKLDEQGIRRELGTNHERIVKAVPGVMIRLMRPPYGAYDARVMRLATEMGYRVVLWDVDTNDWRKRTSDQMIRTILNSARDGSIILMHDRYQTTLETTSAVIDALGAQGYRFVTVSELLDMEGSDKSFERAQRQTGLFH